MAYTRVNWEDLPSTNTPINATNLNKMDKGIKDLEGEIPTNDHLVNVSNEVDEDYRVNLLHSKNLLSTSLELGTFTNSGVKDTSTTNYRTANMVKVKPNTTYTTSINGTAQAYAVYFYTSGGIYISSGTTATFTTPANCEYLNFRCFNADFTSDFANLKVQLEEGNTATTYEAFIQNKIVVDNEKYSDTLNIGSIVDSRNRVNVLKGKNLCNLLDTAKFTYRYKGTSPYYQSYTLLDIPSSNSIKVRPGGGNYTEAFIDAKGLRPNTKYSLSYTIQENTTAFNPTMNLQNSGISDVNGNLTIGMSLNNGSSSGTTSTYVVYGNIQLEEGNTSTTYEPYITPSINVDNEEIYSKPVVLWQNTSASNTFAGQTITLKDSLANYSYYEVIYLFSNTNRYAFNTGKIISGLPTMLFIPSTVFRKRDMTTISGNKVTFLDAFAFMTYGSSNATTTNEYLIPYRILGYK